MPLQKIRQTCRSVLFPIRYLAVAPSLVLKMQHREGFQTLETALGRAALQSSQTG
jgi:hypothetical protein